jgi:Tfp pilus assembly protein PilF
MRVAMPRSFVRMRFCLAGAVLTLAGCNSMNGGLNNQVGTSFYRQGNFTSAREEFQRASANEPWKADYIHNMATAMKRQGDLAGAESTYRRAIAVDPGHQPSYHGLALLLKEQGRTNEAIDLLQGWVDQQPYSAEPYVELAWLKREIGDIAGTEQLLLSALKVKPNDHVATAQLGQLYQDTNQPDRAVAMYRRSLHARWNQPEVQSRMTQLQRGYGSTPTAYAAPPRQAYVPPQTAIAPPGWAPGSYVGQMAANPPAYSQPVPYPTPMGNADPAHAETLTELPLVQPY